jgi:hypothetical protein
MYMVEGPLEAGCYMLKPPYAPHLRRFVKVHFPCIFLEGSYFVNPRKVCSGLPSLEVVLELVKRT